jgi:ubiquinone/menaquinone biosynthesis C-methylase UbiE
VSTEVWKDECVAARFATERSAIMPETRTQLDVLLRLLGDLPAAPRRLLDVGAGDGILLATLLDAFPEARGVAVDFSPPMLTRARERLAPFGGRATVVEGDLAASIWREQVTGSFDAVVSGFAIHHVTHARKRALYAEIYDLVRPGGMFLNLEHVASASPRVEAISDEAMVAHRHTQRVAAGEVVSREQVRDEFRNRPDRLANILALVEEQCHWLREIGFVDVDCFWKWFALALFGGFRSRG